MGGAAIGQVAGPAARSGAPGRESDPQKDGERETGREGRVAAAAKANALATLGQTRRRQVVE